MIDDILPLSPLQEGLLFHAMYDPVRPDTYVVQLVLALEGPLDVETLRAAAAALLRRHAVLRTSIQHEGLSRPVQVVAAEVPLGWEELDCANEGGAATDRRLEAILIDERQRRFDLSQAPLVRFTLIRVGPLDHRLVITNHHILLDGWSKTQLVTELFALYGSVGDDRGLPVPPPYREYLAWIARQDHDATRALWRQELAGLDGATLIAPNATLGASPRATFEIDLERSLTSALVRRARKHGVTLNTMLQAAWAIVLGRVTGRTDVVFGTVVAARPAEIAGIETMIGLLINTLPVRVRLSETQRLIECVADLHARQSRLAGHEYLGLHDLQAESGLAPLFDTTFAFENYGSGERRPAASRRRRHALRVRVDTAFDTTHYPLSIALAPRERLQVRLDYAAALFEPVTVARLGTRFVTALEAAAADPSRRIGAIAATAAEHCPAAAGIGPARTLPAGTVLEWFEAQVARTPAAVAVVSGGAHVSYAALNECANRLATQLGSRVGPEHAVAIALPRSDALIASILAVLKTGAAYLPVDPSVSAPRLAWMLADARVAMTLTSTALASTLPAGTPVLCVDSRDAVAGEATAVAPADVAGTRRRSATPLPAHAAYILYTSGSSGVPKAVTVAHHGLCNLTRAQIERFAIAADSRVLQFSAMSFDAAVSEWATTLAAGATLVVAPDEERSGHELIELLRRERVTHVTLPPTVVRTIDDEVLAGVSLETLVVAGEACGRDLVARWASRVRLINAYGPAEATVCATMSAPLSADAAPVIGTPLPNTSVYVLDRRLDPMPAGIAGEIYVNGVGVARGYWNRQALTSERFVASPFDPAGARMYRTGDLGRWRPDGTLEFLGRSDQQVKIRGIRVELGEVEAALLSIPGVRDAVAVAIPEPNGARLVAYVVPEHIDVTELRRQLRAQLPEALVPSAVVGLAALPLTAHGKVDRRALPAVEVTRAAYRGPRTPVEALLCELYAEVLGVERVGVDDDFFALGGHSLTAMRLVSRVRAALGAELGIREVFERGTVGAVAAAVRGRGAAAGPRLVAGPRPGRVPVSSAQQRLWFVDRLAGGSAEYNLCDAVRLRGALDVAALTTAVTQVVARHESLRTTFADVDGEPVQVIAAAGAVPLPVHDLTERPEAEQTAAVAAAVQAEQDTPFDLGQGPLLRLRLLRVSATEHVLLRTVHHIVADGWSAGLFNRELMTLYAAACAGRPAPLPPLPVQYADYALWQRARQAAGADAAGRAYWRAQLADLPAPLELPTARPRPAGPTWAAGLCTQRLTRAQTAALAQLTRTHGATLYMTLLAAFGVLLARYSGQDDVVVGTPVATREDPQLEAVIGCLVNTLAMRLRVRPAQPFTALLAAVRQTALEAFQHQDVPFEQLVAELAPPRALATAPICQV
ncbi:MAG TPA: amino acid adenylation domain-containing protein, partial [Methylomirabilota bacterium]|nr:amino acid adenylation domain-containing protein [Methylomirabilota bacterium]